MEELRREFLRETVANLEILRDKLSAESGDPTISESFRRELFRRLHTIKGTSQAFELTACAGLAHQIENLLQVPPAKSPAPRETLQLLICEGIEILLENFRRLATERQNVSASPYLDKIKGFLPETAFAQGDGKRLLKNIPAEFTAVLSAHENKQLAAALENGESFYVVAAFFDLAVFADRFKQLKTVLSERGEVIAAAPAPDFAHGAMGFRFFFTTPASFESIRNLVSGFDALILFPEENALSRTRGIRGVLDQAAQAGNRAARAFDKQVDFEIETEETEVTPEQLKLLFEAAVHLIRNAVDHAIENPEERAAAGKPELGKIKIAVAADANNLILRVSDDGRGIDTNTIRARAQARKLVAPASDPADEEILQLIFAHGFSTSERVTEISGRGVGLDAVKEAAEKVGGWVYVSTEKNRGTIFEVYIPKQDEPQRHRDSEKIK